MKLVLDTNILVSGLRSPNGASAALLKLVLERRCQILFSVPLVFEYEAKCILPEHLMAAGLEKDQVELFVATLCDLAIQVKNHFIWRPQLHDPVDEMVLETAINGQADAIVTFNYRDFGLAPEQFGVLLLTPQQAIRRVVE